MGYKGFFYASLALCYLHFIGVAIEHTAHPEIADREDHVWIILKYRITYDVGSKLNDMLFQRFIVFNKLLGWYLHLTLFCFFKVPSLQMLLHRTGIEIEDEECQYPYNYQQNGVYTSVTVI